MNVASRPLTRASKLPVTQLVFVARGAFPRSTPCVCALRGFVPGRVFPDRTTRRHGLARPPPNWVGWAERVVTLNTLFRGSRSMEKTFSAMGLALIQFRVNSYFIDSKTSAAAVINQAGLDANEKASTVAATAVLSLRGKDTLKALTASLRDL